MRIRQFVKHAGELVAQQKGNMALKLAKGSCASMEAYNREVGRMEGLDIAVGMLKDMVQQLEDQEEEKSKGLPEMPPITPPPGMPKPGDAT
jgi:hypothetical protein